VCVCVCVCVRTKLLSVFEKFYFFIFFLQHFLQQYRHHRIHSFTNTKHTTTLVAAAAAAVKGGGVGVGGWGRGRKCCGFRKSPVQPRPRDFPRVLERDHFSDRPAAFFKQWEKNGKKAFVLEPWRRGSQTFLDVPSNRGGWR